MMKRTKLADRALPVYSVGEEVVNTATHVLGGLLGVLALILCVRRAALDRGLTPNFHQDCPVTRPEMLHSIWCAVNRVTRNGVKIGPDQAVTPMEAVRAATYGGAFAYFEENKKGILKPGAVADLVILDKDPTAVKPEEIDKITVLETIKDGETVYRK